MLSCRAGERLRRLRGSQRDEDSEEFVVDPLFEAPDTVVPDMVPEERLSAASSQRQPLPQQPHHGTLPESTLSLRAEDCRRRLGTAARHADTCESRDEALLVRSRSDAVVVGSAGRMASVGEGGRRGLRLRIDTRRRRSDLLGDSWPEDDDWDTSPA